jgi:hypothetical protein
MFKNYSLATVTKTTGEGEHKMSEYQLDYEKMFKQISARVEQILADDEEYFALQGKILDLSQYNTKTSQNLYKMSKHDQIEVMRLVVKLSELSKSLCEKYSFIDEEVINDGEEENTAY